MSPASIEILDVTDERSFGRLPPCADGRFDHRSCDYWEDGVRGAKSSRPGWWAPVKTPPAAPPPASDNPFAPPARSASESNPFASIGAGSADDPGFNPFAPAPARQEVSPDLPRKLRLLRRGEAVFGSYAKVLVSGDVPAAYTQFGPLSAYPRAQHIRELYPELPQAPLPAVITCIATTREARRQGLARRLVDAVREDLAQRGFAAIEAYPDLTLAPDEASAAHPRFWEGCGFTRVVDDERYPVLRVELD